MFDIFVKRKKVVLDFFTAEPQVYHDGKPVKAIKTLPKWFAKTPRRWQQDNKSASTIKKCPGLVDLYKRSIALTYWNDVRLSIHPNGNVDVQTGHRGTLEYGGHDRGQFELFVQGTRSRNLKLLSQWAVKSKKDIALLMTEPTWHDYRTYNSLSVVPGIIQPKYVWVTNTNYITRPGPQTETINFAPGDPIAMLVPLTDDEVVFRTHLVDLKEGMSMGVFLPPFGFTDDKASDSKNAKYSFRYQKQIRDKLARIHDEDD